MFGFILICKIYKNKSIFYNFQRTFSVDSLRTTVGGSRLQASLADPLGLSKENRRFAPTGGSAKRPIIT
jgi:hypothetical protein